MSLKQRLILISSFLMIIIILGLFYESRVPSCVDAQSCLSVYQKGMYCGIHAGNPFTMQRACTVDGIEYFPCIPGASGPVGTNPVGTVCGCPPGFALSGGTSRIWGGTAEHLFFCIKE